MDAGGAEGADPFKGKEVLFMPGFDGTGPWGAGPMSGGGRGFCNPAGTGYRSSYGRGFGRGFGPGRGRGFGRGFGPGFGRGRGWGGGFGRGYGSVFDYGAPYPYREGPYGPAYGAPYAMDPTEDMNALRAEADALQSDLDQIHRRMESLQGKSSEQS